MNNLIAGLRNMGLAMCNKAADVIEKLQDKQNIEINKGTLSIWVKSKITNKWFYVTFSTDNIDRLSELSRLTNQCENLRELGEALIQFDTKCDLDFDWRPSMSRLSDELRERDCSPYCDVLSVKAADALDMKDVKIKQLSKILEVISTTSHIKTIPGYQGDWWKERDIVLENKHV